MSVPYSNLSAYTYRRASDLPQHAWDALKSSPRNANVILPAALKALADEQAGHTFRDQAWIVCSTYSTTKFILSITRGYMGPYPVFIFTTIPFHELYDEYIRPCIVMLVKALINTVARERVYSVFAVKPVASVFAEEWTRMTGIQQYPQPYYAAKITYCQSRHLETRSASTDQFLGNDLRPAVSSDILAVAELCFIFAHTSAPFYLSKERAIEEAEILVNKNQVWVHVARAPGQAEEIASIVAYTRNTDGVATITKVVTNPKWRRYGCAERLVRRVCKYLLMTERKESVILYVAHDNKAATNVYKRVGFVGLGKDDPHVDGVDPWLEIGFDRKKVKLGHW